MREEGEREGRNDQTKCIFRWDFAENVFLMGFFGKWGVIGNIF